MPLKLQIQNQIIQADVRSWSIPVLDMLEIVLDSVGADVVQYLRSYTNEWRPAVNTRAYGSSAVHYVTNRRSSSRRVRVVRAPGSGKSGRRRAHPGHWADITGDLMRKYKYRVIRSGSDVRLEFTNGSKHAIYVEAMDGFFVLKGVVGPGSIVEDRLRKILPRIAPGWNLV